MLKQILPRVQPDFLVAYTRQDKTNLMPVSSPRRPTEPTIPLSRRSSEGFNLPSLNTSGLVKTQSSTKLTSSQLKALKYAFTWADANFNNALDQSEITELLTALGYPCSAKEIEQLFKGADKDGNGEIDFAEFTDAFGESVLTKSKARRGPANFDTTSGPVSDIPSLDVARQTIDKQLEEFFKKGRFTENVDALFATGITLDMLIEYSYSNPRINTLLDAPQTLTSEGKRRIRRMLCATRNARVLDSKNFAIIVNCKNYDDPLMWEHPTGDAVVSVMQDALLMAGYAVHCIGIRVPATRVGVLGCIRAIAATLPHKKKIFRRKKIKIVLCIVGNALKDHNGELHLIPQDAMLKDLPGTSLSMRDIFNIVPSGVSASILADFGYVYTTDCAGCLNSQADGLGLMTTMVQDKWGVLKRFRQPRGGGFFLFNVLDCLALSESGVSTSDLQVVAMEQADRKMQLWSSIRQGGRRGGRAG